MTAARYQIRRQWIDKAGGFFAWTVALNGGTRPVCIARTWARAFSYVNKKLKQQTELRQRLESVKLARAMRTIETCKKLTSGAPNHQTGGERDRQDRH